MNRHASLAGTKQCHRKPEKDLLFSLLRQEGTPEKLKAPEMCPAVRWVEGWEDNAAANWI